MVSLNRIRFGGVFSNELNMPDLIMDCAFDSDNSEVNTFLTREAVATESYDGRNRRISSFKYTENFAPKFTFLKKGFGDFTQDEVRALLKYLTSKDTTGLLEAYDDDSNVISWASIGNFSEIQLYKIANKRTVGVTAVWDSISPFALSDLHTRTQNVATQINTIMHYWTSTTVSGTAAPQYLFTNVQEPKVGTEVYSVPSEITNNIIDKSLTFYGTISKINTDGSYHVNDTVFRLTYKNTKIKRTYSNKITIDIDTDDNKPVYPRITINHGYGTTPTPHLVVKIPGTVSFNSIVDMADYVENTVYHNEATNTYYYKAYTPTFTTSDDLPEYVNWTTVEVDEKYTEESEMSANTFYYYEYEGVYYWIKDDEFYEEPTRPVYGDWKTKNGTKIYTASDTFEDKTIYSYNDKYYWMAPYNFYKSSTQPNLQTTSVEIVNQHYDFFGKPSAPVITVIKNNTSTEKIVLDGANKIVSTDRTRRIFGDDFNWQWLELYDGKNEITIEGNCEVTFEYREVRKVGEY